eukprot:6185536-Pleurochrysis_carterae.AAC.1
MCLSESERASERESKRARAIMESARARAREGAFGWARARGRAAHSRKRAPSSPLARLVADVCAPPKRSHEMGDTFQ